MKQFWNSSFIKPCTVSDTLRSMNFTCLTFVIVLFCSVTGNEILSQFLTKNCSVQVWVLVVSQALTENWLFKEDLVSEFLLPNTIWLYLLIVTLKWETSNSCRLLWNKTAPFYGIKIVEKSKKLSFEKQGVNFNYSGFWHF